MFLHSGAGLHGHEFSRSNAPSARRYPFVPSAFSVPSQKSSTQRAPTYNNRPARPVLSPDRRLSTGSRKLPNNALFQKFDTDTMSEDDRSYANSEGSVTTADGTKKRRGFARSSISYHFAHPAPTLTRHQKLLWIRPKLLLQLQQLSAERRPTPCIDVFPSTVVVPRLIKKFPCMFRGRGELGINDVVVVKSEDYNAPDDDNDDDLGDDESISNREVLAVIRQLRGHSGSAEIYLRNGSLWHATYIPGARAFEFVATDSVTGQKTTARWVQRANSRHSSDMPTTAINGLSNPSDHKLLFSILNSGSRRHPILASITPQILDIPNSYTSVSSSSSRHTQPTSSIRTASFGTQRSLDENEGTERTVNLVDDFQRNLIQVTGIWIALRLGWCPYFKYDDKYDEASMARGLTSSGPTAGSRVRSNSLTQDGAGDAHAITPESNQGSSGSLGGIKRWSGSHVFKHSPNAASPIHFDAGPSSVPRRALSTGTAFLQRAAARRSVSHSAAHIDGESELMREKIRSTTMDFNSSSGNHRSNPSPLSFFRSSTTTPETPTKPFHRRVQSAAMSSSAVQARPKKAHEQTEPGCHEPTPHTRSKEHEQGPVQRIVQQKHRGGRWKALFSFLRRDK